MWKELMFQTVGTTADAETAMTAFTPTKDATLVAIEIIVAGQAATSLVEGGYIKLQCPTFEGVDMIAHFNGNGLRTAPANNQPPCISRCELRVKAGTPIKGFYYHNVTPVTPEIFVYGTFI